MLYLIVPPSLLHFILSSSFIPPLPSLHLPPPCTLAFSRLSNSSMSVIRTHRSPPSLLLHLHQPTLYAPLSSPAFLPSQSFSVPPTGSDAIDVLRVFHRMKDASVINDDASASNPLPPLAHLSPPHPIPTLSLLLNNDGSVGVPSHAISPGRAVLIFRPRAREGAARRLALSSAARASVGPRQSSLRSVIRAISRCHGDRVIGLLSGRKRA